MKNIFDEKCVEILNEATENNIVEKEIVDEWIREKIGNAFHALRNTATSLNVFKSDDRKNKDMRERFIKRVKKLLVDKVGFSTTDDKLKFIRNG